MVLTGVVFFIILSILVLVHELGHYLTARLIGVDVEEFGLGLPPRIAGKKIKGTVYSVNWLPIGGFVKLLGEDDEEETGSKKRSGSFRRYFWARSKKERSIILLAGVFMNFLLAVFLTSFLLTQGVREPSGRVYIETVITGSPGEQAGLFKGDAIKSVELWPKITLDMSPPIEIKTTKDLIEFTRKNAGQKIQIIFTRNGDEKAVILVPRSAPPVGEGPMGIAISDLEERKYAWTQAPVKALEINFLRGRDMLASVGNVVWRLVTLRSVGEEVAGPVGIAQVTGQAMKFGWRAILEFMSILSLNLAVLNILPIPALDGGRLMFVFMEKLLGKRVKPAFERSTHQFGILILFALILLITINDILRIVRG
ncbi:site-2 protease family protein [Patescibacteria group bacterium]|nr:site-2 protease family protein [Patescibacteria group bacterium]MBU1472898.1 site-2 protease family protein [Patescibacteria group bacterium]MBU2459799.1 site-2 protease family protein [Patescibacteria group bacterium]MBU2544820.1 site-2 protease family protein [Patescibacteria group bacterium]